jgi:zinc protease
VRHTLPNGLTLLVEENHAAPVVAIQVWVRVGSADERSDEAGIAHLHEHMLFKGTARRGPGEIARSIEAAGGEINAWTSFDQTVYHVVLASRFFATGLDVLADAVTSAAFDADELSREIEVVCEEIKRTQDSPTRKLSRELFATAFARHPYGKPVIGTEESVRSFTREGILRFYRRWYAPENTLVVVVGDVNEAETRALSEKLFVWPEHKFEPAPPRILEPRHERPLAKLKREPLKEGYLSIAWPSPPLVHDDVAALDALAIVLGHGDASRLHRALKRDRLLCTEVQASCYTPVDPGLTIVGLTLQPQTAREAVREALAQVYRVRDEEVSGEELSTACRLLESDAVYQRETVQGQARKLGFYQSSAGGLEFEQRYLTQVAQLTPAKLREAASLWIEPRAAVLAALLPEGGPTEDELQHLLEEAALTPRRKLPRTDQTPEKRQPVRFSSQKESAPLLREELPGGGVLLVKEERAVPLVAMRAAWPGGLRAEDASNTGVNMLLSRLVSKGTKSRGAEKLTREMEQMGGSLGGNSGRNSFGLRAEFLSRHLREGFDIFAEAVAEPAFDPEEVQRERTLQIDELRAREDNPAGVSFLLFSETLYKKHPYRFDTLGTEEAISRLDPGALAAYRQRFYPPGAATLAVVGDVDAAEVRELVREKLAPRAASKMPQLSPPPEDSIESPRAAVRTLDKAQAHLVVGFPGVRLKDVERWSLEMLSTILSGQGGRLFVELRDKRSLAYSVTSFSMEGVDPGYFAVYIGCGPNKTQEALDGIRAELDRCRNQLPTAAEMDRARTHLVGTHAISLQRNSARAALYAFDECYGLGPQGSRWYPERISAVTAQDVLQVAQRVLLPSREVSSLVAPEGAIPKGLAL